jgi:hypothetical protein
MRDHCCFVLRFGIAIYRAAINSGTMGGVTYERGSDTRRGRASKMARAKLRVRSSFCPEGRRSGRQTVTVNFRTDAGGGP